MCSQPQPPQQLASDDRSQRPGPRGMSINHLGQSADSDPDVPAIDRDAGGLVAKPIHAHGFHLRLFFSPTRKAVMCRWEDKAGGIAFIPPPMIKED